jgi:hypothetical protein
MANKLSFANIFLITALIACPIWILALLRPASVYADLPSQSHSESTNLGKLRLLFTHRPVLLATLIWSMWNFAPGFSTPTFYYLTNTVKLTEPQFGMYNALFSVGFCPILAMYGVLCRYFTLKQLLFWGTIIAVPQIVPLLWIHSALSAYTIALLMGAMGGVCSAAYYDLLFRSCPKGLEGTGLALAAAGNWIAIKWGDVLGAKIYDWGGFLPCVAATTLVYALILVVLRFVPHTVTSDTEEEAKNRLQEYSEAL